MSPENDSKTPQIDPKPDGPYIVTPMPRLSNSQGEEIPAKPVSALCRCGGSGNKPFCDGTHAKIQFSSKKENDGSNDKRDNYADEKVTIHDNRGICAHIGYCTDGLPTVFRMGTEPWIDPNGATVDEIVAAVRRCPSGALSHSIGEVEYREQERDPAIVVSRDGPYFVTGGVELNEASRGEGASLEHYALCRCGGSKNKPFCDGTHWYIEFKDGK